MLREILRTLDYRLSIAWLIALSFGVLITAGCFGLKIGGIALLAALFLLGGWECIWTLLWHPSQTRIDEGLDQNEARKQAINTRDNPTLR